MGESTGRVTMEVDDLFEAAARIVMDGDIASIVLLQRGLRIGYARAFRMIEQMVAFGLVAPYEGGHPWHVIMTADEFAAKMQKASE